LNSSLSFYTCLLTLIWTACSY